MDSNSKQVLFARLLMLDGGGTRGYGAELGFTLPMGKVVEILQLWSSSGAPRSQPRFDYSLVPVS